MTSISALSLLITGVLIAILYWVVRKIARATDRAEQFYLRQMTGTLPEPGIPRIKLTRSVPTTWRKEVDSLVFTSSICLLWLFDTPRWVAFIFLAICVFLILSVMLVTYYGAWSIKRKLRKAHKEESWMKF